MRLIKSVRLYEIIRNLNHIQAYSGSCVIGKGAVGILGPPLWLREVITNYSFIFFNI